MVVVRNTRYRPCVSHRRSPVSVDGTALEPHQVTTPRWSRPVSYRNRTYRVPVNSFVGPVPQFSGFEVGSQEKSEWSPVQ